ncbi:hypothetical protein PDESU_03260 [Pontiella desulfatans]|uniref:Outer membrane porin, OprD family n=1 Tax=Pontiella desulfatans TaxID=2750659 RepID=A0A6C2U3U1_PONDE|nr:OprD family porin [Pontiella desulfatans]VGO14692.1 hypothetical protein PDESU_03260 [Pontiella desulfatans]
MKKTTLVLATAMIASFASAEGVIEQFNNLGYGTLSGRLQALSMYRDFENNAPDTAHSTTLGLQLNYLSPEKEGWSIGATYNGAGVLDSQDYGTAAHPGDALVANGRVNVLNEGYLNYNMEALGLTNTSATVGRKVNNAEVFRADDFRQKPRSIGALQFESKDVKNHRIAGGHAWRMSNWIDVYDRWDFNDFGDVFGTGYDTDGVTWGEVVNNGIENLEVAAFDAVAWDVANLFGLRAKWDMAEKTSLLGYYRNEVDVGRAADHKANVFGLSLAQKVGEVKLEGGYFGVYGDNLRFQETTTGINHALGSSMMLYSGQFVGDSHTLYAKAVTTLESSKTTLYGLYNATFHDQSQTGGRSGHEVNVVAKQPIPKLDNLTVALKIGLGYRDLTNGTEDTIATDTRLFITYAF